MATITPLRAKQDPRKLLWKIEKRKLVGTGWKRFGGRTYFTSEDATKTIDKLIELYPNEYTKH
ncbi:MAG: hypothetical protein U1C59_06940 [Methylotenera sp.]|nr:hypothetical protein [Methylotenera sp.]